MPHPMIMTVWTMHWKLVLRCCLITRSYLGSLFLFLSLVSKTFWPFLFPFSKVNLERMHSCHHLLLIICEILRVIASLLKSRVVLVLCCFLELHDVFSLVSRSASRTRPSNRCDGRMGTSDVPEFISCVRWAVLFNWCQISSDQSHSTRAGSPGDLGCQLWCQDGQRYNIPNYCKTNSTIWKYDAKA